MSTGDRISIAAVGDIMLGDSSKCIGFGLRSAMQKMDPAAIFARVKGVMAGDIVFGNLECVLSDHDNNSLNFKKAQMRGLPSSAHELREAGFTVLNVANNHALQHGAKGFSATCNLLEQSGIGVVGVRGASGYLCRPLLQDIRGKRTGILGYAMERDQYYSGETLYAQGSDDEIVADVARLRGECDYVVVSMHWGDEFVTYPSEATIHLARRIIDAGANVIIGHHPHVVQDIEEYDNGLILYSLGNFVSDMAWDSSLTNGVITKIICENGTSEINEIYPSSIDENYSVAIKKCLSLPEFHHAVLHERKSDLSYYDEVNRVRVLFRNKAHFYIFKNAHKYNPLICSFYIKS